MSSIQFRRDLPDPDHFVGRTQEISLLMAAMTEGVDSLAAVMGGRGMGKSSLLLRVERELQAHPVHIVHVKTPGSASAMLAALQEALGVELKPHGLEEGLRDAIRKHGKPIGLLIDEVEGLLAEREGIALLNNLRSAYENLRGPLRMTVAGGAGLMSLLDDKVSPFLRSCQRWCTLRGLHREDLDVLLRVPDAPVLPSSSIDLIWEHTNGHPLLVRQAFAHIADESARTGKTAALVLPDVLRAMERDEGLRSRIFPMWWKNLQDEGQRMYRKLLRCAQPVRRVERARRLGPMPDVWIPVLESTGVAREESDELVPRGELFRTWVLENIPEEEPPPPPQVSFVPAGADDFEQEVISTVAQWVRGVREFPLFAIRTDLVGKTGNARLQVEAHFQLGLVLAFRARGLLAEPEALSGTYEGYTDIKVSERVASARRACVECKIWGRERYKEVVQQAIDYSTPTDTFAVVVMVDRWSRPLAHDYRRECLGAPELFPQAEIEPRAEMTPTFITEQPRAGGSPLRVYHFLLQLPPDGAA